VEIPSPYAGTVVELRGEPGETLEVGNLLARIATGEIATGEIATGEIATGETEPASSRRQPVLVGDGVDEVL
jgi:pyruvate dehydrogenase E2 component (dihydrolipoamide acetyltransferase)